MRKGGAAVSRGGGIGIIKRELPEGWEWKKVGDIGEYINGKAFKPSDWTNSGKPIIRIQNLTDINAKFNFFDGDVEERYLVNNGDILISWSASLGVFIWDRGQAILNQHIFKAIPNERIIDRRYFVYVIKTVITKMINLSHGSTMKHIVKSDFNKTKIPLPTLPVQHRIVEILDQAATLRHLRAQADFETQKLIQSIFYEMFGDPILNNKGWALIKLDELCIEIHRYPSFYGFEYSKEGVPVLKISNMDNKGGFSQDLKIFDKIPDEINQKFPRTIVKAKDIIFEARGTFIGKCAIVPSFLEGANISPNTIRISLNFELILPEYFLQLSFTKGWKTLIESRVNYWKGGFGTIRISDLKDLVIPLPPLPLQYRFAHIIQVIESTQEMQKRSKEEINTVFDALVIKEFPGR